MRVLRVVTWKRMNNNGVAYQRHLATDSFFLLARLYRRNGFFADVTDAITRKSSRRSQWPLSPLSTFLAKRRYYERLEAIPDRSVALRPFTVHRLRKRETRYVRDTPFVLAADIHSLIRIMPEIPCPLIIALQARVTRDFT